MAHALLVHILDFVVHRIAQRRAEVDLPDDETHDVCCALWVQPIDATH